MDAKNILFKMNIEDFNISGEELSTELIVKINKYHAEELFNVWQCSGIYAYPSNKSCYRSPAWEIERGRSGTSEHCFRELGACDVTCPDFAENWEELLDALIDNTEYLRFAIYEGFIHCDYKDTHEGRRLLFDSTSSSKWTFKSFIK